MAQPARQYAPGMRSASTQRGPAATSASAPRLTVVARPRPSRSNVPFVLLCTAILLATLGAVLALNISMGQGSYELSSLQRTSQKLVHEKQTLAERNQMLGAPQELERRARAIGMVPAGTSAYVDLATGKIIGDPHPAAADEAPKPGVPVPDLSTHGHKPYHGMGNEGD
ncbi:hypothetical protein [Devriesea agamarum]|uniref:hypothetical protein n=1 Tax=Devriesea agamarum TaxID=472569 RepID=UPI00071DA521|nr:hypothetical protein [Devriesea agamarum]